MGFINADNEKALIAKCIEKDPVAQKKLFDMFTNRMYAICLRYAGDRDEAKDFLQEGFIRVFKNLKQFEFKGSFEGWVKRIFVNTAIEFYRKNAKDMSVSGYEGIENQGIDDHTFENLKVADLMQLVQQLPKGYKTVFNLFAIEGFSHEEIAEQLGVTVSTSKSQLFKARLQLQDMLRKQY